VAGYSRSERSEGWEPWRVRSFASLRMDCAHRYEVLIAQTYINRNGRILFVNLAVVGNPNEFRKGQRSNAVLRIADLRFAQRDARSIAIECGERRWHAKQ